MKQPPEPFLLCTQNICLIDEKTSDNNHFWGLFYTFFIKVSVKFYQGAPGDQV